MNKTKKTNKTTTPQAQQSVNKKDAEMPHKTFDPAIFEMINPSAAGIDVASEEMWVCVPAVRAEQNVRKFGAFTDDLYAIADWLTACGISSVAMESTGVYWIPLYQVLEQCGFAVCLTNARHLKNVSGRPKTDPRSSRGLDCQWIQRLHSYGFLNASFRPTDEICQIRSIQRHRDNLIRQASQHVQHMQKALHQMNVLLPKVVTDITGAPKAMTATAHKIAVIFYHMVRERTVYREAGEVAYTQQQEQRMLKRLKKQAKRLGYVLTPQEA